MPAKKTVKTTPKRVVTSKKATKRSPVLFIALGILAILLIALLFPKLQKGRDVEESSEKRTAFTSIKEALSQSVSLECSYKDSEGRETVTYMKNGAIRSDMMGESAGSVIVKDNTMYSWDENSKEGIKMVFDSEGMVTDGEETKNDGTWNSTDEAAEELEQYKDNCTVAVVSDSLFTPPADITFTDFSEMMKNPESFMNQYGN